MARTKASELAKAQQRRARETYDVDSEEEERPGQRPRLPPARATPASPVTKPLAADGTVWDIEGDWIVTTNDEYKPGPYKWSVFDAGDAVYANFALPSISGILKLDKTIAQLGPPRRTKSKFSWRGRESGEGQMCTDWNTQTGELVFKHVEGGFMLLEGSYSGPYGGCKFVGQRVAKQPSKTENNWNFYTYERYEAERRGRWR